MSRHSCRSNASFFVPQFVNVWHNHAWVWVLWQVVKVDFVFFCYFVLHSFLLVFEKYVQKDCFYSNKKPLAVERFCFSILSHGGCLFLFSFFYQPQNCWSVEPLYHNKLCVKNHCRNCKPKKQPEHTPWDCKKQSGE